MHLHSGIASTPLNRRAGSKTSTLSATIIRTNSLFAPYQPATLDEVSHPFCLDAGESSNHCVGRSKSSGNPGDHALFEKVSAFHRPTYLFSNPPRYGSGGTGAWFSVPITLDIPRVASFDLVPSNTLTHTWILGDSLCQINRRLGMVFDCDNYMRNLGSTGNMLMPTLYGMDSSPARDIVDNVYGSMNITPTLYPTVKNRPEALALLGNGSFISYPIVLNNIKIAKPETIGVFRNEAPAANGYLSLQSVAYALFNDGSSPGPNYHLYLGEAAEYSSSAPDVFKQDAGKHVLIFGGYDSAVFNLNRTKQHKMVKIGSGRRMELNLVDIVYRWTKDNSSDHSILTDKRLHVAVIDTSTPYLWITREFLDTFMENFGSADFNHTLNGYQILRSCEFLDCSADQRYAHLAVLDFKLENGDKLSISFAKYMRLQSMLEPPETHNMLVLPMRALENRNSPIILGRAVMAGLHLWVDYEANYFGLAQANTIGTQNIVPWTPASHKSITNGRVDETQRMPSITPIVDTPEARWRLDGKSRVPMIAGIVGGVVAAAAAAASIVVIRRRRAGREECDGAPGTAVVEQPSQVVRVMFEARAEVHEMPAQMLCHEMPAQKACHEMSTGPETRGED